MIVVVKSIERKNMNIKIKWNFSVQDFVVCYIPLA